MKSILGKICSFRDTHSELEELDVDEVRSSKGHPVKSYSELVSKLAQLSFANPDMVLLMRGQSRDYQENSLTTLFPNMYRMAGGQRDLYSHDLRSHYGKLEDAERRLYNVLHNHHDYWDRVGRNQLARWAILQHYEVCPTPLLDLTHSALVACSFAFLNQDKRPNAHYFLFVVGVPQISGSITVSANHALQIVRLASVCPPATLRPYFQEGYLIGTYPSVDTLDEKMRYSRTEMDCAQRLVAKFKISTAPKFWDNGFTPLPKSAIYPEESSQLCRELERLKQNH